MSYLVVVGGDRYSTIIFITFIYLLTISSGCPPQMTSRHIRFRCTLLHNCKYQLNVMNGFQRVH
ncbi:hypothetical protein BLOT_004958 [Blomia tropicalis]|nr:hypothetical protein BLOT_004958 [Blomia tropicalis]